MTNEPTLQRIWEARRKIYAQCDNDPQKLVAYYIERQKQNPQRLLQRIGEVEELSKSSTREHLFAASPPMEVSA